jgi:hypothetical protein
MRMLLRGPSRVGPILDRWTFGRIVELFRQNSWLYDPSRIRQALTAPGWRCPRPVRRAAPGDEATIAQEWPWITPRYTTWRLARRPR